MNNLDEKIRELRNNSAVPKESGFSEIFKFFVSQEGIMGKTKITPAQRNMLYVYGLMHQKHPTWGLDKAADRLAVLLISEDGESRRGMIELFRGLLSQLRNESVSIETGNTQEKPVR